MAEITQWNEAERAKWDQWLESRPAIILDLATRFPPTKLYRLRSTDQRVTIHSYSEDGTLTVNCTGQFNRILFSRRVFGILPEDLEECDLPGPDEELGDIAAEAGYSKRDILEILIPQV